ncbi:MAG: diguanylate cyclase [Chloroflexota bacterium]|nr:diguanylate cyclase [Chloroflexota bacterium]
MTDETLPFYDPHLRYQENYARGPFGLFAGEPPADARGSAGAGASVPGGVAPEAFLGAPLRVPFGIPAGPLLNAAYVAAAFRWGYDFCYYKTVRSRPWPAHAFPNVLQVTAAALSDDGTPAPALQARPFAAAGGRVSPAEMSRLSITNSFGMPAQPVAVWQADVARARAAAGPGQLLAVSVVGTVDPGDSPAAFAADFARTAALAAEAGAPVIEANLSCPNVGGHGLLCHDIAGAAAVCAAIKARVPDRPLLVKLGNYPATPAGDAALAALVAALAPYVAGFSAINAVPYPVVDATGAPALPGADRLRAGICGAAIRDLGLQVVRRLATVREASGGHWGIIGVGGVTVPADYHAYRQAGADVVQAAAGPMWHPRLALDIASDL